MSLFHRGKLEIKLGEYAVGQGSALVDPQLVTKAQDYRRHTAGRMIPLQPGDILSRFPAAEYRLSLKVDGEFSLLAYADGEACLVNPGGTVRVGLPLLKEAVKAFQRAKLSSGVLAGELYYTTAVGKRPRVHDVSRVARQPASAEELNDLQFAAFDIVNLDGKLPEGTNEDVWRRMTDLLRGGEKCHVVEGLKVGTAKEIETHFRTWVEQGAEGAVVRSDTVGSFKIKPLHTLDAVVIGFTEGTYDRVGMLHDLLVALMRDDGCLHVVGHVGGGFSDADRRGLLSDLKDMIVESDYTEVNDHVAYRMVRPEWVVEVSVLDVISQTTRGEPIRRSVLNWNAAARKFEIVCRLPLVALISPQFVRRREDKTVNSRDLRLQQVTDIVEVAYADRDARKLDLAKSAILRREVWTKVLKGQTMVRKLVMWQTNKAGDGDEFPAYVLHYTDYSPGRKTPLDRDIRVSSSREQMDELWKELAEEAFVKGWAKVTTGDGEPPVVAPSVVEAPKKKGKRAEPEPSPAAEPMSEAEEAPSTAVAPAPKKRGKAKAAPAEAETPEAEAASPPKKKASPKKKAAE